MFGRQQYHGMNPIYPKSEISPDADATPSAGEEINGQLERIRELMQKPDPTEAVWACDAFNRDHPDSAEGWHVASQLALKIADPGAALRAIEHALRLEPDRSEWLLHKARCLLLLDRKPEARVLASRMAQRLFPKADLTEQVGLLLSSLDMYEQAEKLFLDAVKLAPQVAGYHYNLATVQRILGKLETAETSLDRAISLDPDDADALALRSGIRRQTSGQNHIEELKQALSRSAGSPRQTVTIFHALAKELEDVGEHAESFSCLKKGADIRRKHLRYDVQRDIDTMTKVKDVYSDSEFVGGEGGFISASPIFVIGMPRTGTTLVERILGSHTRVHAAGELNTFALGLVEMARGIAGTRQLSGPGLVELSRQIDFQELGRLYIERTREFSVDSPHFVDKMPMNFLYAGLIHRALPKAKIIHVDRNPMDTCYAVYKTLFESAYPYSYDLQELGRYFVAYRELMSHWNRVMPGVMHTVRYEDLVSNHRRVTEAMLEYCHLSWEEQCLRPHESDRHSTTASAAQVRRPVHQESVGLWEHYRDELQPLAEILRGAGIEI